MTLYRIEKLQELLRHEVANVLQREFSSPGTLLTVNRVAVAKKGEHATVYVSVYPPARQERVEHMLHGATFRIQQAMNKQLQMRPVPQLRFTLDESTGRLAHIDRTLQEVHNASLPYAGTARRKLRKTA